MVGRTDELPTGLHASPQLLTYSLVPPGHSHGLLQIHKELTETNEKYFTHVSNILDDIAENDKVTFEVKFINRVKDVYKFQGFCFKNTIKVSEAEFSAMITYK